MSSITSYSRLDRIIHNLAFDRISLQDMMAEIENNLFSKQWAQAGAECPIFITSLPRAGTTILLEVLHRLPNLTTHTYRDMPFVLTPILWAKFSIFFHHQSQFHERAHGDGLKVNEDSPEAFEEILWRKFYSHKYTENFINLWKPTDTNDEFTKYFREHMKKIVALRQPSSQAAGRYLSKNNGNIARLGVLRNMFPDANIIIPLRNPIEHAISLWRQHKNFSRQHAEDYFICKYMGDIGHYEFGALHRPIQFETLSELIKELKPESLDYWLAYWIAAFEHMAKQPGIEFISYESFCKSGVKGITRLCEHLNIKTEMSTLEKATEILRAPPPKRGNNQAVQKDLMDHSSSLHENLLQRCLLVDL